MPVTPIPAATLVIVRDSPQGPEVLLQQRSEQARFVASAWVFPGGKLEARDQDPAWDEHCLHLSDAAASQALGLPEGGRAYWIAAIRECFEEAGLLPAQSPHWLAPAQLNQWRRELSDGGDFLVLCQEQDLKLRTDRVHYLSHWVTPPHLPLRYDTRFFITLAPEGQEPQHDQFEAVDTRWLTPAEALRRQREGHFQLILPTLITLQQMADHGDCQRLLAAMVKSPLTR